MFRFLIILLALMPALGLAQIPPQPGRAVPPAVPSPGIARPFTRPGAPPQPGAAAPDPNAKPAMRPEDAIKADGSVELQYPNTPLSEILLLYEELTGLKIIRDANAEQATVSIETTGQLPKEKAIMFIEKSLLLNGYAFTPAGEGMVKLLAFDAKKPSMEGAPLIEAAVDLPQTDQVVSHVVTLKFLNSEDATKAIDQVIPRHSYGVITPVPNARALVITENSNTIRSIIALLERLDNKPVETVQKTIQLTRATAEDVKKALDEILGTSDKSGSSKAPAIPQNTPGSLPGQPMAAVPGSSSSSGGGDSAEAAPPKIISITRRNCLLVIGAQEQVDYISKLVEELDAASELRNFVSRPLKYLAVDSAMQIISDAISRTEGDDSASSGGGGNTNSTNTQNTNSQNRNNSSSLFNSNSNNNSLGNNSMGGGLGGGGLGGSSSSFGSGGGNLTPMRQNNGPTSMLVGKTLLISDPVANSIYASGPPEHLLILNEIMDELDRRPQQIIISAVIGDYQTTENRGFSLETAFRGRLRNGARGLFGQVGASAGLPAITSTTTNNNGGNNNNNNNNNTTTTSSFLDPRSAIGAAANYAVGNGFSFYGGINQGLDLLVNTLESDNNFKVLARPTIFTQNNTPATLTSGLSFPIAASTQSSLLGGVSNNSFLSNVQYQDIVLSLNIIPLINSDDELTLQISQQNSERAGNTTVTGNVYPIISKQELNTVVACRNNSTVLLGGLIRNDENKTGSSVPILSSIPVLNKLLGSRTKDKSSRELLIFIQPRIVRGLDDLPPSIQDSVGASPFADEAQAAFRLERNAADRARLNAEMGADMEKPRLSQRLKKMLNRIILND